MASYAILRTVFLIYTPKIQSSSLPNPARSPNHGQTRTWTGAKLDLSPLALRTTCERRFGTKIPLLGRSTVQGYRLQRDGRNLAQGFHQLERLRCDEEGNHGIETALNDLSLRPMRGVFSVSSQHGFVVGSIERILKLSPSEVLSPSYNSTGDNINWRCDTRVT